MRLWLARHATPLIAPGICYGQEDVAADAEATRQAAQALHAALPAQLKLSLNLRSSPLQRCGQLAEALCALRGEANWLSDARLKEMHFGQWEGRAWSGIAATELQAWTDDFATYAAGGTGESVQRFMRRVAAVFDELATLPPCSDAVWITHAGVIRAVSLLAQGVREPPPAQQWPLEAPAYGQWWQLDLGVHQ